MEQKHHSYIWSITGNLVGLYIVNHLVEWNIPFILSSFKTCVPIISFSIIATIAGDGVLYIADPAWLRSIVKALVTIVGMISLSVVYTVFPFDLSSISSGSTLVLLLKFAMVAGLIGAGIGAIVEFIKGIYLIIK